jgi:hypothetical protein
MYFAHALILILAGGIVLGATSLLRFVRPVPMSP